MAVGEGHIIVLTTKGEAWATGENGYGQLGIGSRGFEAGWVKVIGGWGAALKVLEVGCGPWCSWVKVGKTANLPSEVRRREELKAEIKG